MPAAVQGDYALLVDELKKLYPPQYTPNQAYDEFSMRKQMPNEKRVHLRVSSAPPAEHD